MKKLISSCILLLCTGFILAQSSSELTREFSFENDSDPIEFVVEVQDGSQELLFALNSFTMGGDLKVSLLSPSGKKEGGFRLQSMPGKNKVKEKSKTKEKNGASSISSKSKSSSSTTTTVNTNSNSNSNSNSQGSASSIETTTEGDNTFTYSMSSDKNSISKGNMNKTISNPESGVWKVVIDPAGVTGELLIRIRQKSRN